METYQNYGGSSGISGYEIGDDYIVVQFNDGSQYLYNYSVTGQRNVEEMKTLAIEGEGLNSFINTNVRKRYAKKLR